MSLRYIPALRFRLLTPLYDPLMERWTGARTMRRAVIEALDLRPGLRLLELGCGPGRLAIEIKHRWPDISIDALDVDPAILEVARRNAANAGVAINFRAADITDPRLPGVYDRVYSTLVFHHLHPAGKQRALAGLRRILRDDGRLVVADFGRPQDWLQWALLTFWGFFDGIKNTASHRDGGFEELLRSGFAEVRTEAAWRTAFGTLELFVCRPS